jgi:hypothetical protein
MFGKNGIEEGACRYALSSLLPSDKLPKKSGAEDGKILGGSGNADKNFSSKGNLGNPILSRKSAELAPELSTPSGNLCCKNGRGYCK